MDFKYKILNIRQIKSKKGQIFNCVDIFASWCDKIIVVFVDGKIVDLINSGDLNDQNIGSYIRFRYQDGKLIFSIDID